MAQVSISVKNTTPMTSGNQAPCRILLMLAAKKGTSTIKKRPTSGTAHINGYDIVKQANEVRRNLGTVLAGERSIYWKLSGRENLEYFAALYHIPPAIAKKRVEELIERMELKERANELVEKYSTGMRQRIAISKALLARPLSCCWTSPRSGWIPRLPAI